MSPDAPNYTPRISGLVKKNGDYTLSILKSADGDPASCRRYFFAYEAPRAGQGHFIHTYMGDGTPLPSFVGETGAGGNPLRHPRGACRSVVGQPQRGE